MSTPNPITWLTPAGNLGWIPDSIFYQNTLYAETPQLGELIITATQVATDIITCNSTQGLKSEQNIQFYGTAFGGLVAGTHYFVDTVISETQFTISDTPFASRKRISLSTATGTMTGKFFQAVYYSIIAGELPPGIQCALNGVVSGVPSALASIQGVPLPVGSNKTFKWTVQAYTETDDEVIDRINDRTFELTVVVAPGPAFITPQGQVGTYYDSDEVDFRFEYNTPFSEDITIVELASGQLPGGLTLTPEGRLYGYIQPTPNITLLPGYDQLGSAYDKSAYDFLAQFLSKNYEFTLRVTNGKKSELRTFSIFVYSRDQMTADDSVLIDNNTFIGASETTYRAPFIVNAEPSNLGIFRSENYFAYQFVGEDYSAQDITYAISVNAGFGSAPGISLDPVSGWYYGYIPDQGTTEISYSFNIVVYQTDPITPSVVCNSSSGNTITVQGTGQLSTGQPLVFGADFAGLTQGTIYYVNSVIDEDPETNLTIIDIQGQTLTNSSIPTPATLTIECTASSSSNNYLTCFSTGLFGVGQPLVFTGTEFGGITADPQTIYYVHEISSETEFSVATTPTAGSPVQLSTATGSMTANMILASKLYPFTMTITGAIDTEVTWVTPADDTAYEATIFKKYDNEQDAFVTTKVIAHDLGAIDNGGTSRFYVEAVNRGGRTLLYKLASGDYNELPQGLTLLPTGEIAGRVSFDTFALDLGTTTFDRSLLLNRDPTSLGTTFDSTFIFTVNAYAPDTVQTLYSVRDVVVNDGGTGYSDINLPTIEFSTPIGASAVQAQAGNVTVVGGAITSVEVANVGDGYTSPATVNVTQGFGGSGASLTAEMFASGTRDVISVYRTCSIKVVRKYNRPYQNLYIRAMPPESDRALVRELLDDDQILVPDYLYRPDDPNFGKSNQVTYYHAYGLEPTALERYVASLYENHYYKNLTLGEIKTAQAVDPDTGDIIYEVVYSKIIDSLVNDQGESVNKIVNLPYPIIDPRDGSTVITQVYPNSLVNMRDQVIDVVGQESTGLPLWMTSKQNNGRILGFTPAWVIAYTKPGRSNQIAYYINRYYGTQLNLVDFGVDRYIIDRVLSKNWDTDTQHWNPNPPTLTTFDRFSTGATTFLGQVNIATKLAFADVNNRPLSYINALGGLDGIVLNVDNNTIIFAKQEAYDGPPGSSYSTTDDAWLDYYIPFDSGETEGSQGSFDHDGFDQSVVVPGGDAVECTATFSGTNDIYCDDVRDMREGQSIKFTSGTIGGIVEDQIYYVYSVDSSTSFRISETQGGPVFELVTQSGSMTAKPADERMAIYKISVDASGILRLTLLTQTYPTNNIQITRGSFYKYSTLYYPGAPGPGLTRVSWLPLITVVTNETIFDKGSMAFIDPVDMYDPTDTIDKYLVFPKQNILY